MRRFLRWKVVLRPSKWRREFRWMRNDHHGHFASDGNQWKHSPGYKKEKHRGKKRNHG